MSSAAELLEVMRWQKTGERSAMGSGPAVVCRGWAEARKIARRWMARGGSYYVSIMPHEPPFADRREFYAPFWDWFCATSGDIEFRGEHLDAPDNIAAGSSWECSGRGVSRHVVRGGRG